MTTKAIEREPIPRNCLIPSKATAEDNRRFSDIINNKRKLERESTDRASKLAIAEYSVGRVAVYFPLGDPQSDEFASRLDRPNDIPPEVLASGGEYQSTGNRFVNDVESAGRIWRSDHALSGSPDDDAPLVLFFELTTETAPLLDSAHLADFPGLIVFSAAPALPRTELARRFHAAGINLDDFEPSAPAVEWTAEMCHAMTDGEPLVWNKSDQTIQPTEDHMTDAAGLEPGDEIDPEDDAPTALDLVKLRTGPREPRVMLENDIITAGHVTKFVAGSGVGKTVFLADCGVHWSLGYSALDRGSDGRHRKLDGGPRRVLYIDGEVGPSWWADYLDRFDAPLHLPNLIVVSMESIAPLTTAAGAQDMAGLVERYRPDAVILDTLSSFIDGAENDSDTWIAFDNRITLPLKAMGLTVIYADHSGKDPSLGARGSSAKRSKLDAEWTLTVPRADRPNALTLSRLKDRSGLLPERVNIKRLDGPLGHIRVSEGKLRLAATVVSDDGDEVPADGKVAAIVTQLDDWDVSTKTGRPSVAAQLRDAGFSAPDAAIRAAIDYRRSRDG